MALDLFLQAQFLLFQFGYFQITGARRALRGHLLSNATPPRGRGLGPKSIWTEMALLVNETEKRKRWLPVRQLTARAGAALQALKPCWMMSPLAVAQYVRREGLQFDLCIIDEASQMPPEDAVGAIARSKQVMVVGDTNQLPPTSFFSIPRAVATRMWGSI